MVSDRTNPGRNGPRRRSVPERDLISAYVEHLSREQVLAGLNARVHEFDFEKPERDYPEGHPVEIDVSGHIWQIGQYEGKLQIQFHPIAGWRPVKRRAKVMNVINSRIEAMEEITLHDGSRWRQVLKDNSHYAHPDKGAIYGVYAFYEKI